MASPAIKRFDTAALYRALDEQRAQRELTWSGVAREIWALSSELNVLRPDDHPFSTSSLRSLRDHRRTSCQHAMFMLRWLDRAPEAFLDCDGPTPSPTLPDVGPGRRLRLSLKLMFERMEEQRHQAQLTRTQVAAILGCQPGQLAHLANARYATDMGLAMAIVQWTGRPSTDFMYAARW